MAERAVWVVLAAQESVPEHRTTEQDECFGYRFWKRCIWRISPTCGIPRTGCPETIGRRHEACEAVEVSFELWFKRVMRVFAPEAAELVD